MYFAVDRKCCVQFASVVANSALQNSDTSVKMCIAYDGDVTMFKMSCWH